MSVTKKWGIFWSTNWGRLPSLVRPQIILCSNKNFSGLLAGASLDQRWAVESHYSTTVDLKSIYCHNKMSISISSLHHQQRNICKTCPKLTLYLFIFMASLVYSLSCIFTRYSSTCREIRDIIKLQNPLHLIHWSNWRI